MNPRIVILSALLCIYSYSICAQTAPQYYNDSTVNSGWSIQSPLGMLSAGSNKAQWLFLNSMFPQAPSGMITSIYLRGSQFSTIQNNRLFNFSVKMGQTTMSTLPPAPVNFLTGLTTVYVKNVEQLNYISSASVEWFKVTLQTPFYYDNTKNLIVEVYDTSGNTNIHYLDYSKVPQGMFRYLDNYASSVVSYASNYSGNAICKFGFDMLGTPTQWTYNNAGAAGISNNTGLCPAANQTITVRITNAGHNRINSLKIGWYLDGVKQTDVNYTTMIDTFSGANTGYNNVNLGTISFATQAQHTIKFYTFLPNGVADTVTSNDTATAVLNAAAPVAITTVGSIHVCSADTANVLLVGTGNGSSYTWKLGAATVQGGNSNTYTATRCGTYTLTANLNGCTSSATITVDSIVIKQKVKIPAYPYLCAGDTITLKVDTVRAGMNYQWKKNGVNITGATDSTLRVYTTGSYSYVASIYGCSALSDTTVITTRPKPVVTKAGLYLQTYDLPQHYQWYMRINSSSPFTALAGDTLYKYKPLAFADYCVVVSTNCADTSNIFKVDSVSFPGSGIVMPSAGPQYFNDGSLNGTFIQAPFGFLSAGENKDQWLLLNSLFPQAPSGMITSIYFRGRQYLQPSNNRLFNFSVKMGQTTMTTLPLVPAHFLTGLTTVYVKQVEQLNYISSANAEWFKIDLQTPFYYDNTKNLILEAYDTMGVTDIYYASAGPCGSFRYAGNYASNTVSINNTPSSGSICVFGFDIGTTPVQRTYDNAGAAGLSNCTPICGSNNQTVKVRINNAGYNRINSLKIGWYLDGVKQPDVNYNTIIDTFSAANTGYNIVSLGTVSFATQAQHTIKFYTYQPNGVADLVTGNDTQTIVVHAAPSVNTSPAGPIYICAGNPANVTLTPTSGGSSYSWIKGGTTLRNDTYASPFTVTSFGTYTLNATIDGCNSATTIQVDSFAVPKQKIQTHGLPFICLGDTLMLQVGPSISGMSYQWKQSGVNINGGNDSVINIFSPGKFSVSITLNNCSAISDTLNVLSKPKPTPTIKNIAHILNTDTANITSYQWYISTVGTPAPTALAGETTSICIPKMVGDYTVKVSNGSCFGTSSPFTIDNNFLSIHNINAGQGVYIYPNPAQNKLNIAAPANCSIAISSVDGKLLLQQAIDNTAIDLSKFADGIYIIKVTNIDNIVLKTEKLVKSNR